MYIHISQSKLPTMSGKIPCRDPDCNKEYGSQAAANAHYKRDHEGIRYPCTKCGKIFKENSKLKNHDKEIHQGIKRASENAKCTVCHKDFKTKQKCKEHYEAKHTDKTFPCDLCSHTETSKGKLAYHKSSIHKNNFNCEHCKITLASKQNLKKHVCKNKPHVVVEEKESGEDEVEPNIVVEIKQETGILGKREHENPGVEFIDKLSGKIKRSLKECYFKNCFNERLAWGELDGNKVSCGEHKKDTHVNLSDKRICVYTGCVTKGCITIIGKPKYSFCSKHMDHLEQIGLPKEYVKRTKFGKICTHEGVPD